MSLEYFDLNNLTGHQFEDLVEKLIQAMGFVTKERMPSADGGIDILANYPQPIFEGVYIIQCKRYSKPVSVSIIRDLYGVVHSHNANKGILITNSTYTKPSIEFAENKQLELIDGEKLVQLLVKHDLLENNKIKSDKVVQIRNSWRIYNISLIQPLNKLIKEMEDYKKGLVFVNKKYVSISKWNEFSNMQGINMDNYMVAITKQFQQILPYINTNAREDSQIIQKYSHNIINSSKMFLDNYKKMYAIDPPLEVRDLHRLFLCMYVAWFDDLTNFVTWFENIMKNPPIEGEKMNFDLGVLYNKAYETYLQERDPEVKLVNPELLVWGFVIFVLVLLFPYVIRLFFVLLDN